MQISNEKYKTLLANNKEDNVTEFNITNNKNHIGKSPCKFITESKSLKSIFLQTENNEELLFMSVNFLRTK